MTSLFHLGPFCSEPFDFSRRNPETLSGAIGVRYERPDAVVGIQHRLFSFLHIGSETRLQRFAFANEIFQSRDSSCRAEVSRNGRVHLCVELADFPFERERTVILVLSPADDVAANDLTAPGNKFQVRMLPGEIPAVVGRFDDVGVADVFAEMPHTILESDHFGKWSRAVDRYRGRRHGVAVQHQAIQAAFTDRSSPHQRRGPRLRRSFTTTYWSFQRRKSSTSAS